MLRLRRCSLKACIRSQDSLPALPSLPRLQALALPQCKLPVPCMRAVGQLSTLTRLNVSHTNMADGP